MTFTLLTLTQDPLLALHELGEKYRLSNSEIKGIEATLATQILLTMFENDFLSKQSLPGPRYRNGVVQLLTGDADPEILSSWLLELRDIYHSYDDQEVVQQMRIMANSYLIGLKYLLDERILAVSYKVPEVHTSSATSS